MLDFYRPFQGQDAIMKHNNAMGANTMYFPVGKIARGANTMVKKNIFKMASLTLEGPIMPIQQVVSNQSPTT